MRCDLETRRAAIEFLRSGPITVRKVTAVFGFEYVAYAGNRPIVARGTEQAARDAAAAFLAQGPQTGTKVARYRVACLECGKKFLTTSITPTCPGCGGSDCEVL